MRWSKALLIERQVSSRLDGRLSNWKNSGTNSMTRFSNWSLRSREKKRGGEYRLAVRSLTTFSDLYDGATPAERKKLLQLRINQLVWNPTRSNSLSLMSRPLRR